MVGDELLEVWRYCRIMINVFKLKEEYVIWESFCIIFMSKIYVF